MASALKVDPFHVVPGHVLGALTAVGEDQHAGVPLAEVGLAHPVAIANEP